MFRTKILFFYQRVGNERILLAQGLSFLLGVHLGPVGFEVDKGHRAIPFVSIEDIGASPEGLDPAAFFVSYQEIMAKTQCIQIGCGADRAPGPLTDQAVYFCFYFLTHTHLTSIFLNQSQ